MQAAPPPPILPSTQDDTCQAHKYSGVIGQDITALERVLILGMVRLIRPDTMVTMDMRPERINFHINADEKIVSITCG